MKINIGIVGYGNLGKAVEHILLSKKEYNLVAIFSHRLVKSRFNTLIESYENISLYKNKIDIMLLCGGSFGDIEKQTSEALLYFDCINTFDNHKKILSEYSHLDLLAKTTKHRLIMSCGWDPGIFSIIRAMCYAFSDEMPIVFWGKGISMGHSNAIRKTKNVIDGIEFTIPNQTCLKLARKGKLCDENRHFRDCYVLAKKKYHKSVESQIKNIPDYFKDQETNIHFISDLELCKLKSNLSHKGEIISNFKTIDGKKSSFNFKLKTESNPSLTATIMIKYIEALQNLKSNKKFGAFTPLDIPATFLFKTEQKNKIINKLC